MNRCAPSISREERSVSSHSNGLVCGKVSSRSAAVPGRAVISPTTAPRKTFCFMTELVIEGSMSNWDKNLTRRQMLRGLACTLAGVAISKLPDSSTAPGQPAKLAEETLAFIRRCARPDGGYDPSPDPAYEGNSDTSLSDLAGVTYAATLAKTMGWELPHPERSIGYIQQRQQPDGSFIHLAGKMDPKSDLALLYNTVQGVVALRALGERPKIDPIKVMDRFFVGDAFKKLPWYSTSFFPLFYAALGKPFPQQYDEGSRAHPVGNAAADGYLGDHA